MLTSDHSQMETLLQGYLSTRSILIVDPASTSRSHLASTLAELGADPQRIALVGSVSEAKDEILRIKPEIIFSDFTFEEQSPFDLIPGREGRVDESIFILMTKSASQSIVANAAEANIDAFIIKPFQAKSLREILEKTIKDKTHPNPYLALLEAGKEKLFNAEYDDALELFLKAMQEDPRPTLACFYAGQTEFMRSANEQAEAHFEKGLSYSKIHYKCLLGLFDLLNAQKKYKEAYRVMNRIVQYYPANARRLELVLRLAIVTENFQDMNAFLYIYQGLPERTESLEKYMCSALLVTGKYYLRQKKPVPALDAFTKAVNHAAQKTYFYLYVIEALVEFSMRDEASQILDRLYVLAPGGQDYRIAKFLVSTLGGPREASIQMGQNLITEGVDFPSVHEKLIALCTAGGYHENAENLLSIAINRWPLKKTNFLIARSVDLVPDKITKK